MFDRVLHGLAAVARSLTLSPLNPSTRQAIPLLRSVLSAILTYVESTNTKKLLRLYYSSTFFSNLAFTLPIWAVFGHDYLGLSYFLGIAIVALPDLVSAILNVPTGVLSDRYGRRLIYQVGLVLALAGSLPFVLTKNTVVLFAFIPLAGLGAALVSGNLGAIVSAEFHQQQDNFRIASSNQRAMLFSARIIASLLGSLLYSVDPRLPFVAWACATMITFALSFQLPNDKETIHTEVDEEISTTPQLFRQTLGLYRQHAGMRTVFLLLLALELLGNMMWTVYQPAFQHAHIPAETFGVVFAVISALSIAGSQLGKRLMRTHTVASIYTLMLLGVAATAAGFAFLNNWLVLICVIPLQLAFGMMTPVSSTYIASRTPLAIKSTSLSILEVSNGFWVVASLVTGALLDGTDVRTVSIIVVLATLTVMLIIPRKTISGKTVATAPNSLGKV
jgi:MFS family permease